MSLDERCGGTGGLMADSVVFSDLISRRELIDMGFFGLKFTWRRVLAEAPIVSKHLDRFLMNIPARLRWDEAVVRHLLVVRSDHNPLLLSLVPSSPSSSSRRPFSSEWEVSSVVYHSWGSHLYCLPLVVVALEEQQGPLVVVIDDSEEEGEPSVTLVRSPMRLNFVGVFKENHLVRSPKEFVSIME
ncbi:hypothetical protein V2J09_001037 [Rumex salicifolius]